MEKKWEMDGPHHKYYGETELLKSIIWIDMEKRMVKDEYRLCKVAGGGAELKDPVSSNYVCLILALEI